MARAAREVGGAAPADEVVVQRDRVGGKGKLVVRARADLHDVALESLHLDAHLLSQPRRDARLRRLVRRLVEVPCSETMLCLYCTVLLPCLSTFHSFQKYHLENGFAQTLKGPLIKAFIYPINYHQTNLEILSALLRPGVASHDPYPWQQTI